MNLNTAVIATTIIALAGNSLFTRKEKAVMFFRGSVYGLQVGAPVVFRGVRVGSVVEGLYREIRALRIYEGATEVQQLIIGKAVLQE